jgi:hypothetical protein
MEPLVQSIGGLTQPVTTPLGMDPAAREAMLNQYTRATQGATDLAANQLRERMGAATGGMVAPGESGLADTALGGIYRGGAADVAKYSGGLAAQEAMAAPERAQALAQLNLQRLLAGGNMGQMLTGAEQAGNQMTYQQQQDALAMLMSMYGGEQNAQQAAWSPYYSGIVSAYGG